jgi:hypothetical protein
MHDEPVNDLSPNAKERPELDVMRGRDLDRAVDRDLDERLIRALETVPDSRVPADFAARIASRLPARRPVSLTATHYGQNAMLLGIVATLAVLLVMALHAAGHASFGLLESFLLAEFLALTVWFSILRFGMR